MDIPPAPVIDFDKKRTNKKLVTKGDDVYKQTMTAYKFWEEKIPWSRLESVQLTDNRESGVFFVEIHQNQCAVIKSCSSLANEVFAGELARALGLSVPRAQLIEYSSSEWGDVRYYVEQKSGANHRKVQKDLNRAFFFILEYVANSTSVDQVAAESNQIFTSESFLLDLGRLFVFDILTNNQDRIPVGDLWCNEGNPGNVLVCLSETPHIVAIDNSFTRILSDVKKEQYLQRVSQCVQQLFHSPFNISNKYLQSIVQFLKIYTTVDLDKESVLLIMKGARQMYSSICELSFDEFVTLKMGVDNMKTGNDWEDVWKNSIKTIDLDFLCELISTFKRDNS
ncbi:hypothetical protein AKO1_014253 [Acrasis kona]|uniref:Actin-fragmin kinase catalytic domain-containing protein n=1 Tax=Acrasis kona TaxID=1008807 RepID=A0AAW2YZ15_9EUKA